MQSSLIFCLVVGLLLSAGACSAKAPSSAFATMVSEPGPIVHQESDSSFPDLNAWLRINSRIAAAIKWQYRPASTSDPYAPPQPEDTVAWPQWRQDQKDDLNTAYMKARAWVMHGADQVSIDPSGLGDEPMNMHPNREIDSATARQLVTRSYMWKLYISHVAFSLALELTQRLPWSILDYDEASLRYLFDSTTMAWNVGTAFTMGTYEGRVSGNRADNLPRTAFGPPMWTYSFARQADLIGSSRIDTISRVLDWMRYHLSHFHGNNSFGTYNAVWQYRGYPPLSKIVNGTIDANYPQLGRKHWTAGCHGSVGFLCAILRTMNIPVQPVWICEHELPYFMTEKLYLDHADNPYNDNVKDSSAPVLSLLIDEATYKNWFSPNVSINIVDNRSPFCRNVGRRIMDFIE